MFAAHDGVRLWDIVGAFEHYGYVPAYVIVAPTNEQEREFIESIALNPAGTVLAVGYAHGELRLWDLQTGQRLLNVQAHDGRITDLIFNPDGTRLASGGSDGVVRIWGVAEEQ